MSTVEDTVGHGTDLVKLLEPSRSTEGGGAERCSGTSIRNIMFDCG